MGLTFEETRSYFWDLYKSWITNLQNRKLDNVQQNCIRDAFKKKKTSNLVTLSQLLFTHTHTRLKVTHFNSDKLVFLRPIYS